MGENFCGCSGVFVHIIQMIQVSFVVEEVKINCRNGWRARHLVRFGRGSLLMGRIMFTKIRFTWPLVHYVGAIPTQHNCLGTLVYPLGLDGVRPSRLAFCLFQTMNKALRQVLDIMLE